MSRDSWSRVKSAITLRHATLTRIHTYSPDVRDGHADLCNIIFGSWWYN